MSENSQKEIIYYYLHPLTEEIEVNERKIKYILISSHCDEHLKHGITHESIVESAKLLNDGYFDLDGSQGEKKNFFKAYPKLDSKVYRLIWWWWKEIDAYLWVRTCHPDRGAKDKIINSD
ncbi:MAG: hypothetical protein mread185_000115 [Mycoplasmataceae bacterium]|nr:MAG: hypothetical protein mread185_000115 [Mycoplasmataceae bacterium]